MAIGVCKFHPERESKRRCFQCGQFICTDCQHLLSHHYFCSTHCHHVYQLHQAASKLVQPFQKILRPDESRKSHRQNRKTRQNRAFTRYTAIALPLAIIVYLLVDNYRLRHRLDIIESSLKNQTEQDTFSKANNGQTGPYLSLKPANAMVTGNKIIIEGEAPNGHIVSIKRDTAVLAVTLPSNDRFALPAMNLAPGQNSFVVELLASNGRPEILEKINIEYGSPTLNYLARDFTRGSLTSKKIALTFDGGAAANTAHKILDILAEHNLQVTMFLTGMFIQNFPEVTQRIIDDGHEVGNHTWDHPHLTAFSQKRQHITAESISRLFLHDQLRRTARIFTEITNRKLAPYWRAPFGEHNHEIRIWAAELGYRHIGWTNGRSSAESMDTMDWVSDTTSNAYRTSDQILADLLAIADRDDYGANGGIVLMHLASTRMIGAIHTVLPDLIIGLKKRGYRIVKISNLIL